MPELIDKQKAQTEIALIAKHFARSDAQKSLIGRILFMLDQMPTIEPEVRHGRWKVQMLDIGGGDKIRMLQCSECSRNANMKFDFCPNCGADMREEGADYGFD